MIWSEPDKRTDELAQQVIGAAIEVHRHLGPGYLEAVYEEALAVEFELQGIPVQRQKPIAVSYKNHPVGEGFLVADLLIVELKAVSDLAEVHKAQVISYLKTTNLQLGLLLNFNVPMMKNGIKRIIRSA